VGGGAVSRLLLTVADAGAVQGLLVQAKRAMERARAELAEDLEDDEAMKTYEAALLAVVEMRQNLYATVAPVQAALIEAQAQEVLEADYAARCAKEARDAAYCAALRADPRCATQKAGLECHEWGCHDPLPTMKEES